MIEILLFFLAASLLLYIILGGADYGAGIIELLPIGEKKELQRKIITQAMGPVWEANHIWLILIVVILFMGFPQLFTTVMIHLHLPMVALLLGIVVRGTAFTFRHYDAIHEPRSQNIYSLLFGLSSLWSALWLGIIGASLSRGIMSPHADTFWDAYIAPWWGLFPLTMGCFVASIFCFLASMFLIGETEDPTLKRIFRRRGLLLNLLVMMLGGAVFTAAYFEGSVLPAKFFTNPISLLAMGGATVLLFLLWRYAKKGGALMIRLIAAGQIALILCGWYAVAAEAPLHTAHGPLGFYETAAPDAVLFQLALALCIGGALIFPSLLFLLKVFKLPQE